LGCNNGGTTSFNSDGNIRKLITMFTLSFGHSTSKNYKEALEIAHNLGGKMELGIMSIIIPDYELLNSYNELLPLFNLIGKWKSLTGDYNGKRVEPYRFVFNIWNNVGGCAQKRNDTWDKRHCWQNIDQEGWGCKLIQSFSPFNYGDGRYQRSNRFWYNFGEFTDKTTWKINKNLIFEKLQKTIEEKSLNLCPFFEMKRIKDVVLSLPDTLPVDDVHYIRYYYGIGNPVNIRHIMLVPFEKPELKFSFN